MEALDVVVEDFPLNNQDHLNNTSGHRKSELKRRWYDSIPNLPQAIDGVEKLPPYIEQTVIQSLNDYIDHYRRYQKTHQVSVGVTKIMGLYNASRRSRWYDQKPKTRRAFNMMATIPPKILAIFSLQVLGISDVVIFRVNGSEPVTRQDLTNEVSTILRETYATLTEDSRGLKITDSGIGSNKNEPTSQKPTPSSQKDSAEGVIVVPKKQPRQTQI